MPHTRNDICKKSNFKPVHIQEKWRIPSFPNKWTWYWNWQNKNWLLTTIAQGQYNWWVRTFAFVYFRWAKIFLTVRDCMPYAEATNTPIASKLNFNSKNCETRQPSQRKSMLVTRRQAIEWLRIIDCYRSKKKRSMQVNSARVSSKPEARAELNQQHYWTPTFTVD